MPSIGFQCERGATVDQHLCLVSVNSTCPSGLRLNRRIGIPLMTNVNVSLPKVPNAMIGKPPLCRTCREGKYKHCTASKSMLVNQLCSSTSKFWWGRDLMSSSHLWPVHQHLLMSGAYSCCLDSTYPRKISLQIFTRGTLW